MGHGLELAYHVTARHNGNTVEFQVMADDEQQALDRAHEEANRIYRYEEGFGDAPTVHVKKSKV